jgi:hypothetical protein
LNDQQIQDIRQWMRREDKKLEEMFVIMLKTGLRTRNALHCIRNVAFTVSVDADFRHTQEPKRKGGVGGNN